MKNQEQVVALPEHNSGNVAGQRPSITALTRAVDLSDKATNDAFIRAAAAMQTILIAMRQGQREIPTDTDMRAFDIIRKTLDNAANYSQKGQKPAGFNESEGNFEGPKSKALEAMRQVLEAGEESNG